MVACKGTSIVGGLNGGGVDEWGEEEGGGEKQVWY